MEGINSNIPRWDAVELICNNLHYQPKAELLSLEEAAFRIAAEDLCSNIDLPNIKSSRWDGIVFSFQRYSDCGGDVSEWKEKQDYIFSNTGIGIFEDSFDTMVKIEDTTFENGYLKAIHQRNIEKEQFIIPVGERIAKGEILVAKDTKLMPSHLNLLASGGFTCVPVYCPPKVAILPSGNELVPNSGLVGSGQTIESNSFSMRAKVLACGGKPVVYPILTDDVATIQNRLKEAASYCDVIVIGGGSGKGKWDLLQQAIREIGTMHFSSVDHGPGKRTCFSVIDNTPVFGLVGPPGGEEITFDFYVIPALYACLNQPYKIRRVKVVLDEDILPHSRVSFYFTLHIYEDGGIYRAIPLPHDNLDRSIADHNGYIFITKDSEGYKKGDIVEVEMRTFYDPL